MQRKGETMTTLQDVPHISFCRITWVLSETGRKIMEFCHMEEEERIRVIQNRNDGVIIDVHGKRYALDRDSASLIRVEM